MSVAEKLLQGISRRHAAFTAPCAMLLLLSTAWAADLKTADLGAMEGMQTAQLRAQIDISKLRWPAPPAPARITMLAEFLAEKPASPPAPPKKRGWMERISGIPQQRPAAKALRRLSLPYGVVADSEGRIYAADSAAGRILIFDQDGSNVSEYANTFEIRFKKIIGLAIDDHDRVFVTDAQLRSVIVIAPGGKVEGVFGSAYLARPAGAAVDNENRLLYVADSERNRVAVFDADTFEFLRIVGSATGAHTSRQPAALNNPTNVAVDRAGKVYVSDTYNSTIRIFDADGTFLGTIGTVGAAAGRLLRPKGIGVDCDGHVWVADAALNRVQVFDQEGHLLAYFGQLGSLPGQFAVPAGLFIDRRSRIIVSDQGRVQIFRYITDSEAAASTSKTTDAVAMVQVR